MTNKWQCYLLKLNNKNYQNVKRLPHLFIFWRSNAFLSFFLFIFLCYNFVETIFNIDLYSYFKFQFFTYHLSSVAHNATLKITFIQNLFISIMSLRLVGFTARFYVSSATGSFTLISMEVKFLRHPRLVYDFHITMHAFNYLKQSEFTWKCWDILTKSSPYIHLYDLLWWGKRWAMLTPR